MKKEPGVVIVRRGGSRELLLWPLPLRRQGEAGRGWPRFAVILKAPLPNPPLPSQGREQRARGFRRSYKEGRRSVLRLLQRPALVHGDVVGLVALDLVLGIVLAAVPGVAVPVEVLHVRSEAHTSELQSLMRISY